MTTIILNTRHKSLPRVMMQISIAQENPGNGSSFYNPSDVSSSPTVGKILIL